MTTREGEAGPSEGTGAKAAPAPAPGSELSSQPATGVHAQEAAPLTGSITAPPDAVRQLELEIEIERTRERLGETVQELVARADVKGRALAKATEVSRKCKTTMVQAPKSVWGATPEQVRQAATKGASTARERWVPLAVASGVVIIDCLAIWQWKTRTLG
jgi:hypothetical protein